MRTQWRVISRFDGLVFVGLDYGAMRLPLLECRANRYRKPIEILMPQLRVLELSARDELNRE